MDLFLEGYTIDVFIHNTPIVIPTTTHNQLVVRPYSVRQTLTLGPDIVGVVDLNVSSTSETSFRVHI